MASIWDTTKGNVQALANALMHPVDTAEAIGKNSLPYKYRNELVAALKGDTKPLDTALNEWAKTITPMDAANLGLGFAGSIKGVGKNSFIDALNLAQQRAALPIKEGGLGLPETNTAMQRAEAMGYTTPAYNGSNIEGEIEAMLPKSWFSKYPDYASKYSEMIPADGISKDPRVYPVLLKTGKTVTQPNFGLYQDMENALSKKGVNTFKVENVGTGTNDFYVPKESSQVRSIFAAFDPFKRNDADILAGVGAGLPFVDYNKKK